MPCSTRTIYSALLVTTKKVYGGGVYRRVCKANFLNYTSTSDPACVCCVLSFIPPTFLIFRPSTKTVKSLNLNLSRLQFVVNCVHDTFVIYTQYTQFFVYAKVENEINFFYFFCLRSRIVAPKARTDFLPTRVFVCSIFCRDHTIWVYGKQKCCKLRS